METEIVTEMEMIVSRVGNKYWVPRQPLKEPANADEPQHLNIILSITQRERLLRRARRAPAVGLVAVRQHPIPLRQLLYA